VTHNRHGNNKYLTAKTKVSRQYQISHGETKMLTVKPKTHGETKDSTQNQNARQNEKAHGKIKNSRQNQKAPAAKPKPEKGVVFVSPGPLSGFVFLGVLYSGPQYYINFGVILRWTNILSRR